MNDHHHVKGSPITSIDNGNLALSYPRTGKRGVPQQFPRRLYEMLEAETACGDAKESVIGWSESGCAFHINNIKTFSKDILPKFFRTSKFSSFQRNLNLYGFTKVRRGPDTDMYAHPSFIRGLPERLSQLRKCTPSAGKRNFSSTQNANKGSQRTTSTFSKRSATGISSTVSESSDSVSVVSSDTNSCIVNSTRSTSPKTIKTDLFVPSRNTVPSFPSEVSYTCLNHVSSVHNRPDCVTNTSQTLYQHYISNNDIGPVSNFVSSASSRNSDVVEEKVNMDLDECSHKQSDSFDSSVLQTCLKGGNKLALLTIALTAMAE